MSAPWRQMWRTFVRGQGSSFERLSSLPFVVLVTAGSGLATLAVLLFVLLAVSHNQALFERHYQKIFIVNIGVGVVLLLVIAWVIWRLAQRLRKGKFGARLMLKLAMTFALVGLLPGLVMYGVSQQFLLRSLDNWFDQRIDSALQSGLDLGVGTIDNLTQDLVLQTRSATFNWTEVPLYGPSVERLREQLRAADVQVWDSQGQLVATSGLSFFELAPLGPDASVQAELKNRPYLTRIEGLDEAVDAEAGTEAAAQAAGRIHLWAKVQSAPSPELALGVRPERIVHVVQDLPADLMRNAWAVQTAYRDYQGRALAREGLRKMYSGTLSLSLILAVLAAILLAVVLSSRLMRPLLLLSEGVAKLAAGDLQGQVATARLMQSGDELHDLTASFAQMTQRLAAAEAQKQQGLRQLESAHSYLQTILDNQSAGVVVLDAAGTILSANASATRVLREPLQAYVGRALREVPNLSNFTEQVWEQFQALLERDNEGLALLQDGHWEQSFFLQEQGLAHEAAEGAQRAEQRSIMVRGIVLDGGKGAVDSWGTTGAGSGRFLLMLDDITAMVAQQRSQAWAEMARRLAHEIKNPLTPIQLAAEHLHYKLEDKLEGREAKLLDKSVATIVSQVQALTALLDEFRDYARLPEAKLAAMDLNMLLSMLEPMYARSPVTVHWQLGADLPPIMGDAQQLRQVIHNLVQNAQDAALSRYEAERAAAVEAGAEPELLAELEAPAVWVRSSLGRKGERVRLRIWDNGDGIPEQMLARIFEPYITSKVKGTGLGLVVVKKVADEHGARLTADNRIDAETGRITGAEMTLSLRIAPELQAQLPGL